MGARTGYGFALGGSELETSMEMSEHPPVSGLLLGTVFNWMLTGCMVSFSLKRTLLTFSSDSGRVWDLRVGR